MWSHMEVDCIIIHCTHLSYHCPRYIAFIDLPKAFKLVISTDKRDAVLTAHSDLISFFAHACSEFVITIRLKKINILGQEVSSTPSMFIGDYTRKAVEDFSYLGSIISSNLSLDTELNKRIGQAAAVLSLLRKRIWDNTMLTISNKMKVYQACVLSTLLCSSKTWTLYSYQECRLNTFHCAASEGF